LTAALPPQRQGQVDKKKDDDDGEEVVEFSIEGMSCVNCGNTIQQAIRGRVPSVRSVRVNLATDSARVAWNNPNDNDNNHENDNDTVSQAIRTAIEDVGFDVTHVAVLKSSSSLGKTPTLSSPAVVEPTAVVSADLFVSGMTCSMCSQAIETVLGQLQGVAQASVNLSTDTVRVSWDPQQHSIDEIKENIEDIGYEVEGVQYPNDNATNRDSHSNNNSDDTMAEPANTIVDDRWQRHGQRQEKKVAKRRRAFIWSLVGAAPILLLTMVVNQLVPQEGFLYHHISIAGRPIEVEALILWLLTTPILFISGFEFHKMCYFNLRNGRAGMDVLVSVGTLSSYGYALLGVWTGDPMAAHFFETSAVLISFVLAGKWLQALAVRKTSEALTKLMELQSKTAIKVTPVANSNVTGGGDDGKFNPLENPFTEAIVPIQEVAKGDIVKVIRGASIPADGRVVFGVMSVDESMVTGESMPILKSLDSVVLGGTICVDCNSDDDDSNTAVGAAFVEVTGVGSTTFLAQIIELVQDAQTRSVPIQTVADSVSAVFVPTVCLTSLLTYMVWYALCESKVVPASWYEDLGEDPTTFSLMFGIACLVISCPCALGLATPTAVVVGCGRGASLGILIKGGEALEVASKVDSIIFDKTGTLTRGTPVITDFEKMPANQDMPDEHLLWLVGCLERTSEHPLAKAIVKYVEERLPSGYLKENPFVEPAKFRALTGRGASGIVSNTTVAAGNRSFAVEHNIALPREAEAAMLEMEFVGKTTIVVAIDGVVALVLGLRDEEKPDAKASIAYLRDVMKLDVWMVTGDNRRTAAAIAAQLGFPQNRLISEALPAAKVQQVRKLKADGRVVAMIGDGINDAGALAEADVGISVGTAAEIAAEASDLVLVKGDVRDVCTALDLSRTIFRRIQLNLLWSLLYNTLGIPIAAGAFYPIVQRRLPPTVAALAMALSSISVVLSSLSLRLYKPPVIASSLRRNFWRNSREATSEENGLTQDLLSHDFLSHVSASEFTESTAVMDNRTSRIEDPSFDVA